MKLCKPVFFLFSYLARLPFTQFSSSSLILVAKPSWVMFSGSCWWYREYCFPIQTRSNRPYISVLKTGFLIDIYKRWFLFSSLWKRTGRWMSWHANLFSRLLHSMDYRNVKVDRGGSSSSTQSITNILWCLCKLTTTKKCLLESFPIMGINASSFKSNQCLLIEHLLLASSCLNEKRMVCEKPNPQLNPHLAF